MSNERTLGVLALVAAVFALLRLLQRARVSRSHRNVGGLAVATVAAAVVVVLAAIVVIAPGVWESVYDTLIGTYAGD